MSSLTDTIEQLIDRCSPEERKSVAQYVQCDAPLHPLETDWNTTAEAILTAIARATDLTQRGIRGILAEATFEKVVIPPMTKLGWESQSIAGDKAYDFVLQRRESIVRVQVKLQRKEAGKPKLYRLKARAALKNVDDVPVYVVEIQKTRSGEKAGQKTRPYRFGDFDILAVNLHPATGDWQKFMYTVGDWLIPRPVDGSLIDIFQPVPLVPDENWTEDLAACIEWFLAGQKRTIYR